jgi:hypothetical protein
MKAIIELGIEPHLIEEHSEIFETVIDGWKYL